MFADLSQKRCVVTGASSGIGRAIARELAAAGARVIVHYRRSQAAAETLVEELSRKGQQAHALQADVGILDALPDFVARAWELAGGCDVWINNAGVDLLTGPQAAADYAHKLDLLWHTDVRSTAILCRLAGRRMQQADGGVLLNIGWDQADRGMEGDSGELFAAAKNAIMGLSRSLALSLAPSVRVNCIAPGWIRTAWGEQAGETWQQRVLEETPLKRWGTPEDVARMARFLVSPDAEYITGQVINVNGGAIR